MDPCPIILNIQSLLWVAAAVLEVRPLGCLARIVARETGAISAQPSPLVMPVNWLRALSWKRPFPLCRISFLLLLPGIRKRLPGLFFSLLRGEGKPVSVVFFPLCGPHEGFVTLWDGGNFLISTVVQFFRSLPFTNICRLSSSVRWYSSRKGYFRPSTFTRRIPFCCGSLYFLLPSLFFFYQALFSVNSERRISCPGITLPTESPNLR